jgi:glycosyltransferase involved in cell wall biosynthesis
MTTETLLADDVATVAVTLTQPGRICRMRVCILYDCLYPYTIGGAERWYRNLAERLAANGHEVTVLTLRQWERGVEPDLGAVRVVAVGPQMQLYTRAGRRRVLPPIVFGLGVLAYLLREGRRYDVVHTASFPYFALLAAALVRRRGRFAIVVDWHEVWTRSYWRAYLGPVAGSVGWFVQSACMRVDQLAFCFSRLHERRLREHRLRGRLTRLEGQYTGPREPATPEPARPVALFAGRLVPEKRVPALVPAVALARQDIPDLECEIYGDGPEREKVRQAIATLGLQAVTRAPGFVAQDVLESALATALCFVLPSAREGYGLVVIEAAARGVPVVVVESPDNAATELVEEGVNGSVAASAAPEDLAKAIVRIHRAGPDLRRSTADWYHRNAGRLSLDRSLQLVVETYERH